MLREAVVAVPGPVRPVAVLVDPHALAGVGQVRDRVVHQAEVLGADVARHGPGLPVRGEAGGGIQRWQRQWFGCAVAAEADVDVVFFAACERYDVDDVAAGLG